MEVKHRLLNYSNTIIYQNDEWFKFSLDSVLLANFVTIRLRDRQVLDIATGNAPIPMLLSFRTKAHIDGIEIQKEIYDLAVKSINENNMDSQISIILGDVCEYYKSIKSDTYDVITCNPPYFKVNSSCYLNENPIKMKARHEISLRLEDVLKVVSKLLRNGGTFAMVHRPSRLVEILMLFKKYHLEPKRVQFVYPKKGEESNILLIEGTKNGNSGLKILEPLYIYDEKGNYVEEIYRLFGE